MYTNKQSLNHRLQFESCSLPVIRMFTLTRKWLFHWKGAANRKVFPLCKQMYNFMLQSHFITIEVWLEWEMDSGKMMFSDVKPAEGLVWLISCSMFSMLNSKWFMCSCEYYSDFCSRSRGLWSGGDFRKLACRFLASHDMHTSLSCISDSLHSIW